MQEPDREPHSRLVEADAAGLSAFAPYLLDAPARVDADRIGRARRRAAEHDERERDERPHERDAA